MGKTHINMEQTARRIILASVNGDTAVVQLCEPHEVMSEQQYHAAVLERLREERRALTDAEFRKRYWKYIT